MSPRSAVATSWPRLTGLPRLSAVADLDGGGDDGVGDDVCDGVELVLRRRAPVKAEAEAVYGISCRPRAIGS